jgi:hypothetical protein
VRCAKVLAASLAVREVVIAFHFFVAFLFSSSQSLVLGLIVSLALFVMMIIDNDRRLFFGSMIHSLLLTDRVRIGIVLAFIAPILLYILLKAVVRADFVDVNVRQADMVIGWLANVTFITLLFGPAFAESWQGLVAARASSAVNMDEGFVSAQPQFNHTVNSP